MKQLDWKKINNDRDFQRLVNDLFALEINHPAFLSSNPEIGADGGWDGRYNGLYMGFDGVWSFQAKWTKHNLDEAYKSLREELKKELKKAKRNKVQYLLFTTNADLRIGINDHVGRLEKLNDGKRFVEQLFIWPRANLESRIIQYLLLRHNYFDDPQEPMFVPSHLFARSEPLFKGTFIGREESLKNLEEFLQSKESHLLIVHTGGGYGKTHFIVESGRRFESLKRNTQVLFCRPGIRDVNDAINELNHEKDSLVFLDDSERYLDDAKKLIAHIKTFSPGTLKIILSCRSSGKEIVKNLADLQRVGNYSLLELPQLPENELIKILTRTAGAKKVNHPERIIKELNGNLFLIVMTGKFIKGGDIDPGQIKQKIKNNLDQEAINALNEILDARNSKRLIKELSVVVPFSKEKQGNNIIEKLALILGLQADLLNEALDKLIETGLLRTVGTSIRFNPDMKGDVYLSVELDGAGGKELVNQMFENWLSIHPEQITANLAAASRHKETRSANEAVKGLIKKWINEMSYTTDSLKSKNLKLITPIAFLAPEEVINLAYAYIESSDTKKPYSLNLDTYGPVIYQILHIPGFEESVLRLILYLAQKDVKGMYSNYKPASLIKQAASPIEVNISSSIKTLEALLSWVDKPNCSEIEANLAGEGTKEALSGSHEYRESYGNQLTYGRKILVYKEQFKKAVDQFRDNGMKLLKSLISHPNDKIKKMGVEIVSDIGREAASTNNDFWARILSDKKQAIDWLKLLIRETESCEVLSSIEDILVRYWANNNIYLELSDQIADILRNFPRSTEYTVFRYFVSHDLIVTDFSKIEDGAPTIDRWSWLVHNHFRLHDFRQKDLDEAVKKLADKYKTKEEIINYLSDLEKKVKGIAQWQYIPLIETWAKFNIPPLIEIIDNEELFNVIPERFRLGFYRFASDKDKKYVQECAQKILADLNNLQIQSVDDLLDLISRSNVPVVEFLPWLSKIIDKANSYLRHIILHRAYFIFKDRDQSEKNKVLDILNLCLNGEVDSIVLGMFSFLLQNALQWSLPSSDLDKMKTRLFEIIKNLPKIDYEADELITFVIDGNVKKFIELVDFRLNLFQYSLGQKNGEYFDPIPFDGFHSVEGLIKNYEDFAQIMDKINSWRNQKILYSFDVDKLLKNLKNYDEQHGDYLCRYVNEKIGLGNAENIEVACNALLGAPFSGNTASLFLDLLLSAEKAGNLGKAEDVFTHQVLNGIYSSAVGQAPPALVSKKEALEKMYEQCPPGVIKSHMDSLIKSISAEIQRHLDEDEEWTLPKS